MRTAGTTQESQSQHRSGCTGQHLLIAEPPEVPCVSRAASRNLATRSNAKDQSHLRSQAMRLARIAALAFRFGVESSVLRLTFTAVTVFPCGWCATNFSPPCGFLPASSPTEHIDGQRCIFQPSCQSDKNARHRGQTCRLNRGVRWLVLAS